MTDPTIDGYVGVTSRDLERRLIEHRRSENLHLRRALEKYDTEIVLLREGSDKEILELEYEYRPNPMVGWNITVGGGIPPHCSEWWNSDHSARSSARMKGNSLKLGKKESAETCLKKSAAHSGKKLGPLSAARKVKQSLSMRGRQMGKENAMAKLENRAKVGQSKLGRRKMFSPVGEGKYIKAQDIEMKLLEGYRF